jgi:hypothetical protein
MSEVAIIQAGVNDLAKRMLAKGLMQPEAEFTIQANMESKVRLSWVKEGASHDWDRNYSYHNGSFDVSLADAREAITALPELDQRRKAAFLSKLDEVIELGRKTGIEVDFVNPLVETMKRLSENIITHQKWS